MLFNSYTFILFFIAVLILVRIISGQTARKAILLATSYLFYAAWNPPFVLLLWFSTLVDWSIGKKLHASVNQRRRKRLLAVSLVSNLGLLGYFKYSGFLIETFNNAFSFIHLDYALPTPSIILPVGISFYTFQTLSYTFDIYRKRLVPWHSFLDYALYVTFFPQLVAGPIVRAREFLPQCDAPNAGKGSGTQLGWGLSLLVIGLFSKVVIADAFMAPIVEQVYDAGQTAGFLAAWVGTLAFAVQIFCDFFGYSTSAIGIALCLGFSLPDNFRFPYAAIGFSDFWRRWHISLSTWLRDYLYIPLGGNRKGELGTYVNLSITMLLGGLWHGASWMFVIWGGLHGLFLIVERKLKQQRIASLAVWQTGAAQLGMALLTFALVNLAWVFFRANSLTQAVSLLRAMLHLAPAAVIGQEPVQLGLLNTGLAFACTVALLIFHYLLRDTTLETAFAKIPWAGRSLVLASMLYFIFISMTGDDRSFIYFQF